MTSPADISRRDMLRVLALLGLWPLGCNDQAPALPSPPMNADRFVALRLDREAAALIGRTWLEGQTTPPDATTLLKTILPDTSFEGDALRKAIGRAHREDLLSERYESVAGWQLSRTEVHLYALLAQVA
jgi:hypothetical protein